MSSFLLSYMCQLCLHFVGLTLSFSAVHCFALLAFWGRLTLGKLTLPQQVVGSSQWLANHPKLAEPLQNCQCDCSHQHDSLEEASPRRVRSGPYKSVHKSVLQDTRVSYKSAPQECPTRVLHKSVPQERQTIFGRVCAFGFVGSILLGKVSMGLLSRN